jgi:hypothetical protein
LRRWECKKGFFGFPGGGGVTRQSLPLKAMLEVYPSVEAGKLRGLGRLVDEPGQVPTGGQESHAYDSLRQGTRRDRQQIWGAPRSTL